MEVLYQSVRLEFSPTARSTSSASPPTRGCTILWMTVPASHSNLNLHARHVSIDSVHINGTSSSFRHIDPLLNITALAEPSEAFLGSSADAAYRAALEVSRHGELLIDLPPSTDGPIQALPTLPIDTHRTVRALHSRLSAKIASISNRYATLMSIDKGLDIDEVVMDSAESESKVQRLLCVRIDYRLSVHDCPGLRTTPRMRCIYSTSGSTLLYDVDGVRCWLPCLDSPRTRTCFDLSLIIDRRCDVLCSGKLTQQLTNDSDKEMRFITDCAIAPSALGFFIGRAEKYSYPLYKSKGVIWVALDRIDQHHSGDGTDGESSEDEEAGESADDGQKYLHEVRHTTLGLDLATRKLHKFCGRSLNTDSFAQIFVSDLCADHLSYHGLSLLDMRLLHGAEQIYMETPVHLMLLRSYLYCWLRTAIRIDCMSSICLIHGAVGYILNCYVDHVFGEDCGSYRFQKIYDSVLAYERTGRALPLSTEFPESYEWFDPTFQDYLIAKSTVLFHLLEHKADDRDMIRTALMSLIRSPFLNEQSRDSILKQHSSSFRKSRANSVDSDSAEQQSDALSAAGQQSDTPTLFTAVGTPVVGNSTPFAENSTPFIGNSTPFRDPAGVLANSPDKDSRDVFPVPRIVDRHSSVELADVAGDAEFTTAHDFVMSIRKQGGMASTIDDNFIDKYVSRAGMSLLRVRPRMSNKDDNKLKHLIVEIDHASLRVGEISKSYRGVAPLQVRILDNQDQMSEGVVVFRNPSETYVHNIHIKRVYGPRPKNKASIDGVASLTMTTEAIVKRPAIELARAENAAVKSVEVDPYVTCIRELHMTASMPYLIERLHKEVDRMDTLAHTECLRILARSGGPIQVFQEAIQGYYIAPVEVKEGKAQESEETIVELPLSVYARAEAALCVAKCNSTSLPLLRILTLTIGHFEKGVKLDAEESEWIGRKILIESLNGLFTDEETKLPLRNKFSNESLSFLRNALLVALSQIKAPRGQTSLLVVKHLLNFLDNNDNSPDDDSRAKSFDDSHYRALLLNCISTLTIDSKMKNAKKIVKKIIETAKFILESDQTNSWTLYHLKLTSLPTLPGGGLLTAAALNCIAEMEIQELLSELVDVPAYFQQGAASVIDFKEYFISYQTLGTRLTPPIVRSTALESFVRLMWCRQYRFCKTPEDTADFAAHAINAVCDVIENDPNKQVRENAALSLLRVTQYRPSRVALSSLSISEYLLTVGCSDPNSYASVYNVWKLHKVHKTVMLAVAGDAFKNSLKRLWDTLALCKYDQGVRSILLSAWLYCFEETVPPSFSLRAVNTEIVNPYNIPENLLGPFRFYHMCNPSEASANVDKILRYGADAISNSTIARRKIDAPVESRNTTLKISLKRPHEDITNDAVILPTNLEGKQPQKKQPSLKFVM